MFLIPIVVKSFAITFYKSKQTCLKISDRIKNIFHSFILQMIIFICIMIYYVLKKYKNDAHIIKKFKSEFIIDKWFQFRKKVTKILIFGKWFNFQMTFNMCMKKKNCRIYETCRKDKARIAKVYFEIDQLKEKEVEKQRWGVYILFFIKTRLTI